MAMTPDDSAANTFCLWQKVALIISVATLTGTVIARPFATFLVFNAIATLIYLAIILFRLYIIVRAGRFQRGAITVLSAEIEALNDDRELPVYTLLCPMYREAETVGQFIQAMTRLNYPVEKLDILLLLEEDDVETRQAAERARVRLGVSHAVRVLALPNIQPKTKPKACNYGLLHARGEYVVIYDAEDIPEPDQLKKALIAFRRQPDTTVCVQAKLNYFNARQNLLTRFFTAEYSMWFDLFLPGLSAVGSPIPLGGTSNHFQLAALRRLGAWDAFNVAEDADLGMRIARYGFATAIVDSTTWEEANSRVGNWIRQRSRWVKGYMQVWLVAMRHPLRLLRTLGLWRFTCVQITVGGTALVLLLNPFYWLLTAIYAVSAWSVVPRLFPQPILAISIACALAGNLVLIYLFMYGLFMRRHYDIVPLMFLSPVYWVLQSVAAWKGLYQLLVKPHFWEKTQHNLSDAVAQVSEEVSP
jgi:cellulose synthase/poly-beta-1,6-N-acetylglucosamine synthase-like glycosyltransferase